VAAPTLGEVSAIRSADQRPLSVCLLLDPSRVFRWHGWLIERLAAIPGCEISSRFAPETLSLPRGCWLLCHLEKLLYGLGAGAIDPLKTSTKDQIACGDGHLADRFDVVIDLAGTGSPAPSCDRIVTPLFNGMAGEIGIITAFIRKHAPIIEIQDSANPTASVTAHPAPADSDILSLTLDAVLSCAARLIIRTVRRAGIEAPARWARPAIPAVTTGSTGLRLAGIIGSKLARLVDRLARGGKRWTVGWRVVDQRQTLLYRRTATFTALPDDAGRYYADPFPFFRNGRSFIFVEEFPFAIGRGCIAVSEIDGDGRASTPRVVLEEAHHLSYPFVFAHEGEVWMIPEAGESGQIPLYRAVEFPHKWSLEAVLIDGIAGYDATLLRHRNRYWLFVCERNWHSSSWDMLSLFHSQRLTGGWAPHAHNPVLCDGELSRPAGATFAFHGSIVRPVQDCSQQYGSSIKICRLDELHENKFCQTMLGQIHSGADGCHTYNCAAGLEVIDVFSRGPHVDGLAATFTPVSRREAV
jgi:hypothetical protein